MSRLGSPRGTHPWGFREKFIVMRKPWGVPWGCHEKFVGNSWGCHWGSMRMPWGCHGKFVGNSCGHHGQPMDKSQLPSWLHTVASWQHFLEKTVRCWAWIYSSNCHIHPNQPAFWLDQTLREFLFWRYLEWRQHSSMDHLSPSLSELCKVFFPESRCSCPQTSNINK